VLLTSDSINHSVISIHTEYGILSVISSGHYLEICHISLILHLSKLTAMMKSKHKQPKKHYRC